MITFCVGFAALNTGNNLLYLVLSLMLAFVVLSGVLSESALRRLHVRRDLPRDIHAGREAGVWLEVANGQKRFPSFALAIEDCAAPQPSSRDVLGPALGRIFTLRVGAGESERRRYGLVAEKRGPLEFGGFRISTRFPFGLFTKARVILAPTEALIYPAIEPLAVPPRVGREGDQRESGRSTALGGAEVGGVREYSAGDPLRRVHWPTSLRRQALYVRQVEDDRDAEIEVRLRTRGVEPGDAFERSVSWAASEVVAHLDAGLRVGLRTEDSSLEADRGARQRARLLSMLAGVEAGGGAGGADRATRGTDPTRVVRREPVAAAS